MNPVRGLLRHPRLVAVLTLLTVLGCGKGDESRLQLSVQGEEEVLRSLLHVTASAGGWGMSLTGPEIGTEGRPNYTREYRTPTAGTLTVEASLEDEQGNAIALGRTELQIRKDWIWNVDIWLSERDPTEWCMGCLGRAAFPVPDTLIPGVPDSLYLVWGGNRISKPVVY